MSWVADASWTAALFLPDEDSEDISSQVSRMGDDLLLVPELWWYETTNILRSAERRERLTPVQVERIFSLLAGSHDLAVASGLSAYDAAYIELALRRECAIATLDSAVAGAAAKLGVPVRD